MVGKGMYKKIADDLLAETEADELEILIFDTDTALTRYANSKIHQNIGKKGFNISLRAVMGKKVGSSTTNSMDLDEIKSALKRAEKIAEYQREDPHFKGLPEERELVEEKDCYYESTASFDPEDRAKRVKEIIEYADRKGVDRVYGAFKTEKFGLYIANSKGVERFDVFTNSNLTCTAIADWDNDSGFGWSEMCSSDVHEIYHMKVAETAVRKGINNLETESMDLGEYTVILEPLAVKTLLMYLGFMGFSSRAVQEQRSFMNGRFGEQIMHEEVNIRDDALDEDMIGFPFDYEGVPKKRVDIIKNGVANEVVYDTYTAGREEGKESTGHALPMPNPNSPMPMNVIMDGGESDLDEMIEETDNGILITRFNYCRPVHPVKGILTGLTRDGTWRITDGEVGPPIKNLRFTQNLLEAFSKVDLISEEQTLFSLDYYPGYILCPAVKINEFNFTGTTEF
ncbi:MAG: TldD/PmbA family protein [Thermoplasmata archaeon]